MESTVLSDQVSIDDGANCCPGIVND